MSAPQRVTIVRRHGCIVCTLALPKHLPSSTLDADLREFAVQVRMATLRDQAEAARHVGIVVEPQFVDVERAKRHEEAVRHSAAMRKAKQGVDKSVPNGNGLRG